MKKLVGFVITATALAIIIVGCRDSVSSEGDTLVRADLLGEWKLVGADKESSSLFEEFGTEDCGTCFTLTFITDTTFTARGVNEVFYGGYVVDEDDKDNFYKVINYMTSDDLCLNEHDQKWKEVIAIFNFFTIQKKVLKMYYNGGKNYFLFKRRDA